MKARGAWQYIYDGRDLFAVVEQHADGWHVVLHKTGERLGPFPTRQFATAMANATARSAARRSA
jgi:hypothetical protein